MAEQRTKYAQQGIFHVKLFDGLRRRLSVLDGGRGDHDKIITQLRRCAQRHWGEHSQIDLGGSSASSLRTITSPARSLGEPSSGVSISCRRPVRILVSFTRSSSTVFCSRRNEFSFSRCSRKRA